MIRKGDRVFMTDFNRVSRIYLEVMEQIPDEQLVLMCKQNVSCIRIQDVIAQFKYCNKHSGFQEAYCIIRQYLISIFSEEIVKGLEEL